MVFPQHAVTHVGKLEALQTWLQANKTAHPDFIKARADGLFGNSVSNPEHCLIAGLQDKTKPIEVHDKSLSLCFIRSQAQVDFLNACPEIEILAIGMCGTEECPFMAIMNDQAALDKYNEVWTPEQQELSGFAFAHI